MVVMRIMLPLILAFFFAFTHFGGATANVAADGQGTIAMHAGGHEMGAARDHELPAGKKCCDRMAGEKSAGVHCPADYALLLLFLVVLPADGTPGIPLTRNKAVASTQPKAPHRPPISA